MAKLVTNISISDLDMFKDAMRILQQCYQLTSDSATKQYILDELNTTMSDKIDIEKFLNSDKKIV